VGLVLEAICPSTEASLPPHEIESLVTQAEFTSGTLRVVVGRLLAIHAQGQDAVDLIRRSNRVTPAPSRAVDDRLLDARKDLQLLMTRLWSAAGGRVQRTHCRRAWSEFVDLVQPTLARLCPAPRGDESWIVGDVQQAVDGYAALAESICEKYGAKFDDR